jgi:hypothetical protein
MYIPVQIFAGWTEEKKTVETRGLVDCGAGDTFIDKEFVKTWKLPITRLTKSIKVFNVDGTQNKEGKITHFTRLKTTIGGKTRRTRFLVTGLGKEKVIFGYNWLQRENPIIDWDQGTIRWDEDRNIPSPSNLRRQQDESRNAIAAQLEKESRPLWIGAKSTASQQLAEKDAKQDTRPLTEHIPRQYHQHLSVFNEETAARFPGSRPWDHRIDLKPSFKPQRGKIYSLSPREDRELDSFVRENLKKGYIRHSVSPQAAPFFFVKKKDGSLRPCQDYRQLNEETIRNAYPLPRIPDLLDKLKGAKYFTKVDVRWGYNNVRIKNGDQWKAAFVTNKGLFEPTVMFFGLTNSPATFQAMMDSIFEEEIQKGGVVVYMDDILIYADTEDELERLTNLVLRKLRHHDLFLKPEKCLFHRREIDFLGFIIREGQIKMDPTKLSGL